MLCLLCLGCARRDVVGPSHIRLPPPPERIELSEQGKTESPGVKYIDPAQILSEGQTFMAPKDGVAVCTPRTWRGAKYAIEEWPKWGDTVRAIVQGYQQPKESVASWWKLW